MSGLTIAIDFDLAEEYGLEAAVVHQQIGWWIKHPSTQRAAHRPGWFTATSADLSELCPFSADKVRRATAKLVDAGLIEKHKFRATQGDQTCSYRPVKKDGNPLVSAVGKSANSGDGKSANSGDGKSAGCTSSGDGGNNYPPTPLEGGDDGQAELFGAGADQPLRSEKLRRSAKKAGHDPLIVALFEDWWKKNYPTGGPRGSKAQALKKYVRVLKQGRTAAEINERTQHYAQARKLYSEMAGGEFPPLLHGTTFLNGRMDDFDRPWTEDDVLGSSWPDPRKLRAKVDRVSTDDLIAQAEAEFAAAEGTG